MGIFIVVVNVTGNTTGNWLGTGSGGVDHGMTQARKRGIFWGFGLVQSEIGMIYSNS